MNKQRTNALVLLLLQCAVIVLIDGANEWPTYLHPRYPSQICYKCPPGFYKENDCKLSRAVYPQYAKCLPCPSGTFSHRWNTDGRCWDVQQCTKGRIELYSSKSTGPRVCSCNSTSIESHGHCVRAISLEEHHAILYEKDKTCNNRIKLATKKITMTTAQYATETTSFPLETTEAKKDHHALPTLASLISLASLLIISFVVNLIFICYCCRIRFLTSNGARKNQISGDSVVAPSTEQSAPTSPTRTTVTPQSSRQIPTVSQEAIPSEPTPMSSVSPKSEAGEAESDDQDDEQKSLLKSSEREFKDTEGEIEELDYEDETGSCDGKAKQKGRKRNRTRKTKSNTAEHELCTRELNFISERIYIKNEAKPSAWEDNEANRVESQSYSQSSQDLSHHDRPQGAEGGVQSDSHKIENDNGNTCTEVGTSHHHHLRSGPRPESPIEPDEEENLLEGTEDSAEGVIWGYEVEGASNDGKARAKSQKRRMTQEDRRRTGGQGEGDRTKTSTQSGESGSNQEDLVDDVCRYLEGKLYKESDIDFLMRHIMKFHMDACERIQHENKQPALQLRHAFKIWKKQNSADLETLLQSMIENSGEESFDWKGTAHTFAEKHCIKLAERTEAEGPNEKREQLLDRAFAVCEIQLNIQRARELFRTQLELDSRLVSKLGQGEKDTFVRKGLILWRNRNGKKATVEALVRHLVEAEEISIAEEVCELNLQFPEAESSSKYKKFDEEATEAKPIELGNSRQDLTKSRSPRKQTINKKFPHLPPPGASNSSNNCEQVPFHQHTPNGAVSKLLANKTGRKTDDERNEDQSSLLNGPT